MTSEDIKHQLIVIIVLRTSGDPRPRQSLSGDSSALNKTDNNKIAAA